MTICTDRIVNVTETGASFIRVSDMDIILDGKKILEGIDFDVNRGETLVVLGKNGAGKSVLLKAIAGLISVSGGSIKIAGEEVLSRVKGQWFSDDAGSEKDNSCAYVFQKGGLFDSMNVFENVAFGLRRMGKTDDEIKGLVGMNLERVGLAGSGEKLPSELSGGMQKRAGLARALCMEPSVILYDDPTAGLDPLLSDSIADVIIDINRASNATSIVATHDLFVTKRIADQVILLYNGRILFKGDVEHFFSTDDRGVRQFIEGRAEGPIDLF